MFLAPVKAALGGVLLFATLLLTAWTMDWVMVTWVWPDGIGQLKWILARDLALAMELADRQSGRPEFVSGAVNLLYGLIFKLTGIHETGMQFAQSAALSIPDNIVRTIYHTHHDKIQVAMLGTQLIGVRLCLVLMFAPVLVLAYSVALTDGWAQRAIRRASGGRESASLYHRAKRLGYGVAATLIFGGILLPGAMELGEFVLPVCLMLLVLTRVQWTYYKKHL